MKKYNRIFENEDKWILLKEEIKNRINNLFYCELINGNNNGGESLALLKQFRISINTKSILFEDKHGYIIVYNHLFKDWNKGKKNEIFIFCHNETYIIR